MGKIVILDEITSNKIAAGEVVERPASVVKELVENSIDAGATSISIEIKAGGVSYIKIMDNGSGIEQDDVEIAFERHSTSKIRNANDLEKIMTLGFRGEALASIASVSTIQLTTRTSDNNFGTFIEIKGGNLQQIKQAGCAVGTTFVVRDLFYNTPARYKFLKKDSTEAGYISDIVSRIALAKPDISFKLTSNGSVVLHSPGNKDMRSVIYSVYGKEIAKELYPVEYSDGPFKITGFVGKAEIARSNRNQQSFFINGRYFRSRMISSAVEEAFKTLLMKNKFPFAVLKIEINPLMVDVNVHPTKMEVRFSSEQEVFRSIYHAVSSSLLSGNGIKEVSFTKNTFISEPKNETKFEQIDFGASRVKEASSNTLSDDVTNISASTTQNRLDITSTAALNEYHASGKCDGNKLLQNLIPSVRKENIREKYDANQSLETPSNLTYSIQGSGMNGQINSTQVNLQVQAKPLLGTETKQIASKSLPEDLRIIGQLFSTYIVMQSGDEMLLLDQHAAHERIIYQRLKSKFDTCETIAQVLLIPVVIALTRQEYEVAQENSEFLHKTGFAFEDFGNNSIVLRSIPSDGGTAGEKKLFLEVLDKLSVSTDTNENIEKEALYSIACKAAIKANKDLNSLEIKSLLEQLDTLENPFTCPHGRPTVIRISQYELEKKFKRIV